MNGPIRKADVSSLYLFARGGNFGYFNRRFEMVIPAKYPAFLDGEMSSLCRNFSEGFAGISLFSRSNDLLLELFQEESSGGPYDQIRKGKRGGATFIDTSGRLMANVVFQQVGDFHDGRAAVMQHRKWGYIDTTGSLAIPCIFDDVQGFTEGMACVRIDADGLTGFVDKTGRWAIPLRFDDGLSFSQGLAAVKIGDLWGYVDHDGSMIVPPRFAQAKAFSDGLAAVNIGQDYRNGKGERGRWGYIDRTGSFVIEPKFDSVGHFQDGLAFANPTPPPPGVRNKAEYPDYLRRLGQCLYGLIDRRGQFVVPPRYRAHQPFSEGLASIKMESTDTPHWKFGPLNSRWGVIDIRGNIVVEPGYTAIGQFVDGLAEASTLHSESCFYQDDSYYIDTTGRIAWPPGATEIRERWTGG